jgi:hypothetical protein
MRLALLALALLATTDARAEIFPQVEEAGVIFGSGFEEGEQSLILRVDFVLLRGERIEPQVEPMFYWAHLSGDVAVMNLSPELSVPYHDIRFSAAGVRMEEWDTKLKGEAVNVQYSRNFALDHDHAVRVSVLQGEIGAMLPWLRKDGSYDLWVKLIAAALGYRMVAHAKELATYHGLYIGRLGAELGATVYPAAELPIRLFGGAYGDLSVDFSGNTLVDTKVYAGARIDWMRHLRLFAELARLTSKDGQVGVFKEAYQLMAGVILLF